MRARLFSKVGETRGAEFEIGAEATIGRHPQNEVVLEPSLVSSRHARISYDPEAEGFVLEDLGSLNGTALDGQPVAGRERLGHLHVITFAGKHDFIFQDLEACAARHGAGGPAVADADRTRDEELPVILPGAQAGPAADAPSAEAPVEDVERTRMEELPVALPDSLAGTEVEDVESTRMEKLPVALPDSLAGPAADVEQTRMDLLPVALPDSLAGEAGSVGSAAAPTAAVEREFCLQILVPGGGVEHARLSTGENVLGRGAEATIRPATMDISRRHAALTVAGGKVTVRDLGSSNHTYLEGEKIEGAVEIEPGARLRFGTLEARLVLWEEQL